MVSWRNDCLARLVAMEHEALDSWVAANMPDRAGVDAVPRKFHMQDTFPYITNGLGASDLGSTITEAQWGEGATLRSTAFTIRLIIAHATSGYRGEKEELLNEMMPILRLYFEKRLMLTTDTGIYSGWPDWIASEAIIADNTSGVEAFPDGGIGTTQIGEELTLLVPVLETLNES